MSLRVEDTILELLAALEVEGDLTEELQSKLHFIFGHTLFSATETLDKNNIERLVSPSGRSFYLCTGKDRQTYVTLPNSYCSCKSFMYDVVNGSASFCKHQLAALIGERIHRIPTNQVSEVDYALNLVPEYDS